MVEVAPAMLVNVEPPLVLTCHCTDGAGVPVAAAVKLADWPAVTVWLVGLLVTLGAVVVEAGSITNIVTLSIGTLSVKLLPLKWMSDRCVMAALV